MKIRKDNITLTINPKLMDIINKLYEEGIVSSRTQLLETALIEWLINHNAINLKEILKEKKP